MKFSTRNLIPHSWYHDQLTMILVECLHQDPLSNNRVQANIRTTLIVKLWTTSFWRHTKKLRRRSQTCRFSKNMGATILRKENAWGNVVRRVGLPKSIVNQGIHRESRNPSRIQESMVNPEIHREYRNAS